MKTRCNNCNNCNNCNKLCVLHAVGLQGQFLFQLFKAFPLSFGAAVVKEDEGGEADGGVDPETAAAAEGCIHGREEEGEGAAAYPEGKGAGSHRTR